MTKHVFPDAVLKGHTAVLGMTGSGKSSTARLLVEQVVETGARVCVLDTLKSDWWGITSSASGKRAGLPFKILGGPRGHVPLHSSAGKVIGQLVGSGKLPLSIIDMADFEPGGIQRFFVDFAQSLWKNTRGVVYLVIEEAHEVAPKERAGFGAENMSIHWARRIATGSRTKGIRLIVATQAVQQLHNRVLASCHTLIAHQIGYDADVEPVIRWVKRFDKALAPELEASIANLPVGTGWLCSISAKVFEKRHFPKFSTFDNTATPESDAAEIDIKTAPVDQNELKSLIGKAVEDAEAIDVKALQKKVSELTGERNKLAADLATAKATPADPAADKAALDKAEEHGFERAKKEVATVADQRIREARVAMLSALGERVGPLMSYLDEELKAVKADKSKIVAAVAFTPSLVTSDRAPAVHRPATSVLARSPSRAKPAAPKVDGGDGTLPGNEQRVLNSLLTWKQLGHDRPSNAQVAWLAGYSPTSSSYTNPRGALKSKGYLDYPEGRLEITPEGEPHAVPIDIGGGLLDFVLSKLPGNEARVLRSAASAYPKAISNEECATGAVDESGKGYSPTSSSYTNPRGALKSKELITYPGGEVRAVDWLFS